MTFLKHRATLKGQSWISAHAEKAPAQGFTD